MRSKIRVGSKYYQPVPWFVEGECDGCALQGDNCINEADDGCSFDNEFGGMIFIPATKIGMAEYIAKKLEDT